MREPISIRLGETSFQIRPLTLGQVEAIEAVVTDKTITGSRQGNAILAAALGRDHQIDAASIEGTPAELAVAVKAILDHGGFMEGPSPGEALPAAGTTAPDAGAPSAAG